MRSRLLRDNGLEYRQGTVAVPIGIAQKSRNLRAIAIQDRSDRQAQDIHGAGQALARVSMSRQIAHADLVEKFVDFSRWVGTRGNGKHC